MRLGYGISSLAADKITGQKPDTKGLIDVYVVVREGADGRWGFASASWQKRTDLSTGEVELHGRTFNHSYAGANGSYGVRYGVERYYLPEGWGHAIEDVQRERKIDAVIAVSPSGDAQIRALKDNGHLLYQEPAY
ncbi:GDYXXLXY domain-containing protein [Phyllobacterium myrsinacearum]|uniref:Putative membrane-anchored protein n=1 Tax=Phyllobacterium myrsinacearum TaxID=28101 RepID=A0A839EL42_9HYPH|nr:putative membrane-anchored protein [Phyllobacterium myrsinacearum]